MGSTRTYVGRPRPSQNAEVVAVRAAAAVLGGQGWHAGPVAAATCAPMVIPRFVTESPMRLREKMWSTHTFLFTEQTSRLVVRAVLARTPSLLFCTVLLRSVPPPLLRRCCVRSMLFAGCSMIKLSLLVAFPYARSCRSPSLSDPVDLSGHLIRCVHTACCWHRRGVERSSRVCACAGSHPSFPPLFLRCISITSFVLLVCLCMCLLLRLQAPTPLFAAVSEVAF